MKSLQQRVVVFLLGLLLHGSLQAKDYVIAVRANLGIDAAYQKWQATVDYLNNRIPEHHFSLLPIVSLQDISSRAGNKEFDFLLTNPSSYVDVKKRYGARALVTLNNKRGSTAQARFGSVIFTHVLNTEIKDIADLENKRLMVVSKQAFGGWQLAWLEMLENGFNPIEKLKALKETASGVQQDVVLAVLNRNVDAGVVRTDLLERMEQKGHLDMRYLRVINNKEVRDFPFFLSTKLYPEWAFSSLNHISDSLSVQVKLALLSIKRDSIAAINGHYVGWVVRADYTVVENMMKELEVGPFAIEANNRVARKTK